MDFKNTFIYNLWDYEGIVETFLIGEIQSL